MLWTVCPFSNQLGGPPRLHLSVEKLCRSLTSSWSFPHTQPTDHQQAGPLFSSSSPQLKAIISFPSPLALSHLREMKTDFFN